MKLGEIIVRSAEAGLKLIDPTNGTMPAGHNGLKNDPETPVRNTGHWSIVFFKAYEISGDKRFFDAGLKAANYLMTGEARPMGAAFWHRTNPQKDFCNGVIGSAFSIEALMTAYRATGDDRFKRLAGDVFLMHPFDEKSSIWKRVNVDGSIPRGLFYDFDLTFNHQLWFAMSGALIDPRARSEIGKRVIAFLDGLASKHNLKTSWSGRIRDELFPMISLEYKVTSSLRMLNRFLNGTYRSTMKKKETIYQVFSLFVLARTAETIPDHRLWQSGGLHKALRFIDNEKFISLLKNGGSVYWARPMGFEIAKIITVFSGYFSFTVLGPPEIWVAEEIRRHLDSKTNLMNKDSVDKNNMSARIYEATLLPDFEIPLE